MDTAILKCSAAALIGASMLMLGGCSPEAKAGLRSWAYTPTGYLERPGFSINLDGPATGYDEEQLDETTYVIDVVTSEVTTLKQAENIALVRAANIGRARGFTHFIVQETTYEVRCVGHGATPMVDMTVRFGKDAEVIGVGEVLAVEEVIEDLMRKARYPDASKAAKEAAYIANRRQCLSGRIDPPA